MYTISKIISCHVIPESHIVIPEFHPVIPDHTVVIPDHTLVIPAKQSVRECQIVLGFIIPTEACPRGRGGWNPVQLLILRVLLDSIFRWNDEVWCVFLIPGQPGRQESTVSGRDSPPDTCSRRHDTWQILQQALNSSHKPF